ncbi:hypothetical protein AARAC_011046 [Aspergillus arachidicola]|uniref:Uncharacterized protein n=1 Tax=Aspergillus arachidicola TaxID=656916 RepID=A0A2G7FZK4_9EURO|nr:hypothetical protein AARAC_011046 [Aspergillus arachidicola]
MTYFVAGVASASEDEVRETRLASCSKRDIPKREELCSSRMDWTICDLFVTIGSKDSRLPVVDLLNAVRNDEIRTMFDIYICFWIDEESIMQFSPRLYSNYSTSPDTCDFKTIPRRVYAGKRVVRARRKELPEGWLQPRRSGRIKALLKMREELAKKWSQPRRSERIKALLKKEREASGGTSKSN